MVSHTLITVNHVATPPYCLTAQLQVIQYIGQHMKLINALHAGRKISRRLFETLLLLSQNI